MPRKHVVAEAFISEVISIRVFSRSKSITITLAKLILRVYGMILLKKIKSTHTSAVKIVSVLFGKGKSSIFNTIRIMKTTTLLLNINGKNEKVNLISSYARMCAIL